MTRLGDNGAWRWTNLTLAFLLELAALAGLAWWGWHAGAGLALKIALAVAAPLVAAVLWGRFAAAALPNPNPWLKWGTKVLVFGGAVVGLAVTGAGVAAAVLAGLVVANTAAIALTGVRGPERAPR